MRTASGPFSLDAATSLDTVRDAAAAGPDGVRSLLLPSDVGLDAIPAVRLSEGEVADAAMGRFVRPEAGVLDVADDGTIRLLDSRGRIVGIGRRDGPRVAPTKMLVG